MYQLKSLWYLFYFFFFIERNDYSIVLHTKEKFFFEDVKLYGINNQMKSYELLFSGEDLYNT